MNKLLVICGPTATGKTELGVNLAKKYHGEIISADSRQVYKGMDIGTGKDIEKSSKFKVLSSKFNTNNRFSVGFRLKDGIPVWLVDVVEPDQTFNVHDYQTLARIVITDIEKRGKLPVVVGGTGLYIKALVDNSVNIDVPPDQDLRQELSEMSVGQLQERLINLDKARFDRMNHSDKLNPRRLVRAIEIISQNQKLKIKNNNDRSKIKNNDFLSIGLTTSKEKLIEKIDRRVKKRLEEGLIDEIKKLREAGFDWNLPSMSGLGYRQFKDYFKGKGALDEAITKWKLAEHDFAKRQTTWFKADKRINWFDISLHDYQEKIDELVRRWWYTD